MWAWCYLSAINENDALNWWKDKNDSIVIDAQKYA